VMGRLLPAVSGLRDAIAANVSEVTSPRPAKLILRS
jgi:hypothetical protein